MQQRISSGHKGRKTTPSQHPVPRTIRIDPRVWQIAQQLGAARDLTPERVLQEAMLRWRGGQVHKLKHREAI
jgi:2-polyprenyl-6-methoxyphenol hydroxylase-like FAD-dependent oxidoreductase